MPTTKMTCVLFLFIIWWLVSLFWFFVTTQHFDEHFDVSDFRAGILRKPERLIILQVTIG
jgi:hypothetical protein